MHGLSAQAFHWTSTGIFGMLLVLLVYLVLVFTKNAPPIDSIRHFADIMADRGGVILILTVMSLFFFEQSMRLFYVVIDLVSTKQLESQNAIALMAIQFASNSAFGMSFGALLTTMKANAPPASMNAADPAAPGAPAADIGAALPAPASPSPTAVKP
jgi:hypothetical protein